MANCHPESFVEEVRITIIDLCFTHAHSTPPRRKWQDCISAFAQLKELFQRWVDEVHPGDDIYQFQFRVGFDGQVLTGDERPHDLGLHTPTKITATRLIR
ncbi:uncharacterized protein I303_105086 [Kwoniella dejecticola CBS 10117]|uniref:Uncharacterized protein n=1 Tax=Kwoniella dejecticola CBS 10117 TaxID=1296121 RepID=A0A1A6A3H5_9TREE|nr:uncharacterized protein I303_05468 [Kwoniella dejecticola CBS 10117]OBR84609.1 hypothetical protein I303_05468 [Kwoniella dejecticola CBS 10117]